MLWIGCELLNLQKRCAQAQILCKLIILKYLRLICSEAWKPRQAITVPDHIDIDRGRQNTANLSNLGRQLPGQKPWTPVSTLQ